MEDCIFCKIVAGEAPAEIVYADDNLMAFMDIFPASWGHLLIVPRAYAQPVRHTPAGRPGDGSGGPPRARAARCHRGGRHERLAIERTAGRADGLSFPHASTATLPQ
ncbi:MAG: HIT domain-containing protein [Anaerolineae bacterium]|nr:MAG: HIT domain-containing protein [Anaerolineae bacterium]